MVIYESPICPEGIKEERSPVLEKISRLKFNMSFYCGYSPERINPSDTKRNVINIVKVT